MILPLLAGPGVYPIREYGALGNGSSYDTSAIQSAIDACHAQGGGMVVASAGRYLTGPLRLRSNVRLHLEKGAVLLGSADPEDYTDWKSEKINVQWAPYNARYLLIAEDEENISITGEGMIDGQAAAHYDCNVPEDKWWKVIDKSTRPGRMIFFALCRNVVIEGVTCVDAPAWTFWVLGCEQVRFQNVTIRTPRQAINTDGIDIDSCRDVSIINCNIRSGDDSIVFRAIDRMLKVPQPCEQIRVENCTVESHCNAIRFSYLRDGIIRNVSLNNLVIRNSRRGIICQVPLEEETPERGLRRNFPPFEGPVVDNLSFTNVRINARQPLWFWLSDGARVRRLSNLVFENIQIHGVLPSVIKGNDCAPVENVSFRNIGWKMEPALSESPGPRRLEQLAAVLSVSGCRNLWLQNVALSNECEGGEEALPLLYLESVEGAGWSQVRKGSSSHPLIFNASEQIPEVRLIGSAG